ncbi:MAG: hypothetical protein QOI40_4634 [Alphaproteobacteria bacterium]|jgi:hypothetical protein|nr:hypothetical protein [Alphaproteobacteria bacterium]
MSGSILLWRAASQHVCSQSRNFGTHRMTTSRDSDHRRNGISNALGAIAALLVLLVPARAFAESNIADGKLSYRGFTVDMSVVRGAANVAAIEASVKHQIDIAADCGAKPEIISFFRGEEIVLKSGLGRKHGHFSSNNSKRVEIEDTVEPPQKPFVLHELLHAYHFGVLPGRFHNPDVLRFYNRAKTYKLYPANEYMMSNEREFFAVTASLYLWGNVDREPHTRERLKAAQPVYYAWLGRLFGVRK